MYMRELRRLQPNEGQANDSYWKEFCDWTIVTLPDIGQYFSRNIN